jgi:uncharacterized GH25 family protein
MQVGRVRVGVFAGLVISMAAVGAAQSHSPYLLPNTFDATGRDHVTVQASFTERFFSPDVVMKSDDFHTVGPDGAKASITPAYFKDLTILEAATPTDGTWRITSGVRAGRMSKVYRKGEEWVFLEPDKAPPAGVAVGDMQSITTAETYVSRGAPDAGALAATGKGLEFHALTNPTEINVGEVAKFEVLLDGKPLANQTIAVHRADDDADHAKPIEIVSDAAGKFEIKLAEPGVYHAMTRRRIAPAGGQPGRSLTYALTFEAAR